MTARWRGRRTGRRCYLGTNSGSCSGSSRSPCHRGQRWSQRCGFTGMTRPTGAPVWRRHAGPAASAFEVPQPALDAIAAVTRKAGLSPGQAPCVSLPARAWEEAWQDGCPHCQAPIRFNPFVVDQRERRRSEKTPDDLPSVAPASGSKARGAIRQVLAWVASLGLLALAVVCSWCWAWGWLLGVPLGLVGLIFLGVMIAYAAKLFASRIMPSVRFARDSVLGTATSTARSASSCWRAPAATEEVAAAPARLTSQLARKFRTSRTTSPPATSGSRRSSACTHHAPDRA